MNPNAVKIMSFLGLGFTLVGTIMTSVAGNQAQKILVAEEVSKQINNIK